MYPKRAMLLTCVCEHTHTRQAEDERQAEERDCEGWMSRNIVDRKETRNTANVFDHLSVTHSEPYDECKAKTPTLRHKKLFMWRSWDVLASVTAYNKEWKRHRDLTEAITFHLAKETRCWFRTLPKRGFKNKGPHLDKQYEIASVQNKGCFVGC